MKFAGVDLSITSPAVTVFDDESKTFTFHCLNSNTKLVSNAPFFHTLYPDWKTSEERFDKVSQWVFDLVENCSSVFLEGYAYGATGLVFNIAENAGLIKHKLFKANIPLEQFAPATIKKFATGKGNAKKEMMEEAWNKDVGLNIREALGQTWKTKLPMNPSSDIIDSYYIVKLGYHKWQS